MNAERNDVVTSWVSVKTGIGCESVTLVRLLCASCAPLAPGGAHPLN
ncbi:hypothetical protein [Streptomyces sp.]